MLAYARITLRIAEEEFWSLTPAKFRAYQKEERANGKLQDYRFGILQATLRAVNGDKKAKVWDMFPQHKEEEKNKTSFADNFRKLIKAKGR